MSEVRAAYCGKHGYFIEVDEETKCPYCSIATLQKDNDNLKAEVEKGNRKNTDIWAILNGLGLKIYSNDETIQMVWERAEKAEAERDVLIDHNETLCMQLRRVLSEYKDDYKTLVENGIHKDIPFDELEEVIAANKALV